jgi:4-amino-4-deoxy-L-arabinose transferase-like glycosyltransferase
MKEISKKSIVLFLIIIATISLGLKLYTIDFAIPPHSDDFGYVLTAVQYNEGDFFLSQKKHPGWPLVLTPFISIIDSNSLLDYTNLARGLSLTISTVSIFPMYLLVRKYFNEKYSLVASSLFAFEPHLNYNAGFALSEPLLIIIMILTMLFILNNKTKFHYLAFVFAGLCWWIRLEAFYVIIAIFIIYFVVHRDKSNFLRNFSLCIVFLLLIISPLFIQRDLQFDDPFYVWYGGTILSDDYAELLTGPEDAEITDFVEKNGILGLMDKLANGLTNLFNVLFRILYPYLFILIPFGVLFSLRPIDQKLKHVKANWIMILTLIGVLVIPFAIIDERRFLFPLLPFLIVLSTIPIQRVTNYGLSTFSFSERQKSVFLVIVVGVVLLLSTTFTLKVGEFGYGLPNSVLEHEKIEFTKYLVENFDGRILHDEDVVDYLVYVSLTQDDNADFKEFKSPRGKDPYPDLYEPGKVVWLQVNGKTIEELITNGETIGLKYIGILEKGSYFFPFMNDLYYNEEKYPYMEKIFDSNEMNYKEFKIKVFEIDYEKFYLIKNKG